MSNTFNPDKGQNNSCSINQNGDQYVECTECGATAEIGTVIKTGDDVYQGTISAENPETTRQTYQKCLDLAKSISDELEISSSEENQGQTIHYTFKFSCTVEKMIYEMRVRSIK